MEITGGIDWAMWLQMLPPYTPALEPPNKKILNETFGEVFCVPKSPETGLPLRLYCPPLPYLGSGVPQFQPRAY